MSPIVFNSFHDRPHLADRFEREASFALPIGPLLPRTGSILRQRFEPKVFQVDQQELFIILS